MSDVSWVNRLLLAGAVVVVVETARLFSDVRVNHLPFIAAVAACFATAWVVIDLFRACGPTDWIPDPLATARLRGGDARLTRLGDQIATGRDRRIIAEEIHGILTRAVTHRLRTSYGVEVSDDEELPRHLVGDRVHAYLTRPPARAGLGYEKTLSAILDGIETL